MEALGTLKVALTPFLDNIFGHFEKIIVIGAKTTFVNLPALDVQIQPIADGVGMQLPLIKYILALFLAYPMAAILRALPNKHLKHLFSMAGGIFMMQWIFGPDWIHAIVTAAATYLLCLIAPGKLKPTSVFLFVMGYMTISHAYRMYVSYLSGIFDFTGTQMVLTMKLTSFAYNLHDGTSDWARVSKVHDDKRVARIYTERKKFAINALPNPLEFLGYVFCFTCLLAGPAFEYRDYVDSIDGTIFVPKNKSTTKSAPSSFFPGLYRLLLAVLYMAGHMTLSAQVPFAMIYNAEWIAAHPWTYRFPYTLVTLFAERLKYYFVWKIAEGASVMGGFGFEGYDEKTNEPIGWRNVENVDVLGFELATSIQPLSRSWNKRTQGWLERYTYGRTGNSLLATYFVSALWHGLYPGFFLFFMTIPILTNIERLCRAKINPIIVPGYDGRSYDTAPKTITTKLYWGLCTILTSLGTNYCVQVFSLYSWERCTRALGSYHYIPHLVFIGIYILLSILPTPKDKKDADGKKKN